MRLKDFPNDILNPILVHEAFRRLGFNSHNIAMTAQVSEGSKEIIVSMIGLFLTNPVGHGHMPDFMMNTAMFRTSEGWTVDKVITMMREAGKAWKEAPEEECLGLWEDWNMRTIAISDPTAPVAKRGMAIAMIAEAILGSGIPCPAIKTEDVGKLLELSAKCTLPVPIPRSERDKVNSLVPFADKISSAGSKEAN